MISVPFAASVLRRLGQRSRESFWSLFVELFQCLECPSLDRVIRLESTTPDVVPLVLCRVVQQFVRSCVSQFYRCPATWFAFLTATAQLLLTVAPAHYTTIYTVIAVG